MNSRSAMNTQHLGLSQRLAHDVLQDDFIHRSFDDTSENDNYLGSFNSGLALGETSRFSNVASADKAPKHFLEQCSPESTHAESKTSRVTSGLLTTYHAGSNFSRSRQLELVNFMRMHFNHGVGSPFNLDKFAVFRGDAEFDDHILSSCMMHEYVHTYWDHIHKRLPLLHRPTFCTETAPTLLILAVIALGASLIQEETFGVEMTQRAVELAAFMACNLRWHLLVDNESQLLNKLCIFQALILLELYEKMNASRALHEHAHIHSATTINLIKRAVVMSEAPNETSFSQKQLSLEEFWREWINTESTRRVAFAAFILDAQNATMFGNSASMVVQDIQLFLPCDETMWSAISPVEVACIEARLHLNGMQPVLFIHALMKTINGEEVRTNAFSRSIIMAGLMSLSWSMRQLELQLSTFDDLQLNDEFNDEAHNSWQYIMTKAFHAWKRNADEDIAYKSKLSSTFGTGDLGAQQGSGSTNDEVTVLHSLAHITLTMDPVEAHILMGAKSLIGRPISCPDRQSVRDTRCQGFAAAATNVFATRSKS